MNVRQDVLAPSRQKATALFCLLSVCMSLLLLLGLHAHAQSADETEEILEIELLQQDIRHISGQLNKLRQQTIQTGKEQQDMGKALREEIVLLAGRQTTLSQNLAVLKATSQKQIDRLQTSQKQLRWALAVTAFFLCLSLLGWMLMWRARNVSPKKTPPTQPARTTMPIGDRPDIKAAAVRPLTLLTPVVEPELVLSSAPQTTVSTPIESPQPEPPPLAVEESDLSVISTPFSAAPWAAIVAEDLQKTRLAMDQASQDFMRAARTQP